MKVVMLKTVKGSDRQNGMPMPVKTYEYGKEYEIGDELAESFMEMHAIKLVQKPKAKAAAPENKSLAGVK